VAVRAFFVLGTRESDMQWIILIKLIIDIISKLKDQASEDEIHQAVADVRSECTAAGIGDLPWDQLIPLIIEIIRLVMKSREPQAGV
jgi:hypothetical protein